MTTNDVERAPRAEIVLYRPVPTGRWTRIRRDLALWLTCQALPWTVGRIWAVHDWARFTAQPWSGARIDEIGHALAGGWAAATLWIRVVVAGVAATVAMLALNLALQVIAGTLIGAHHEGVIAAITGPVHAYINAHAAGLQTSPATVWALWQLAGPLLLVLAFTGSVAARLAWCGYGAATAAAVWIKARNCIRCNTAHGDESRARTGRWPSGRGVRPKPSSL
jgi:hypothetical protein